MPDTRVSSASDTQDQPLTLGLFALVVDPTHSHPAGYDADVVAYADTTSA